MQRSANYNTRQSEAILTFITSLEGAHVTAAQIVEHFNNAHVPIGRTTVYRHLDKLTETGKLRKYITDGVSGACYQQTAECDGCCSHLHLKCNICGQLQHLECETLHEFEDHMLNKHYFKVDAQKTVLYGKCNNCLQGNDL